MTSLLTPIQAAARIRVCEKTLRSLRRQGLLRYVEVSPRKIFYRPEDCDEYLASCVRLDVPEAPTHRKSTRRHHTNSNVVSFSARRQERQAARGR